MMFGIALAVEQPSPPNGPCASWERFSTSGASAQGRHVDPVRLLGSQASSAGIVVFVGHDRKYLCGVDARDGSLLWSTRFLDRHPTTAAAMVVAEPATLCLSATDAFVVVVREHVSSQYQQVGMVQHSLVTGRERGIAWFRGSCLNDVLAGQRRVPWLRPDWRAVLLPGESVDLKLIADAPWVHATVIDSSDGRLRLREASSSTSPSEGLHNVRLGSRAEEAVQPFRSRRGNWRAAVATGDYVEVRVSIMGGDGKGIGGGVGAGEWRLGRVENTARDTSAAAGPWQLVRVQGTWLPLAAGTSLAPGPVAACGTHVVFSDAPRQVVMVACGCAPLVVVLLERVRGLSMLPRAAQVLTFSHCF